MYVDYAEGSAEPVYSILADQLTNHSLHLRPASHRPNSIQGGSNENAKIHKCISSS